MLYLKARAIRIRRFFVHYIDIHMVEGCFRYWYFFRFEMFRYVLHCNHIPVILRRF